MAAATIPVVLFAYARPTHLAATLEALRKAEVPLLHVYADGAKGDTDAPAVRQTRELVRQVDWCETRVVERTANLGLGRNVRSGIDEIVQRHDAFIVMEDDLVCTPGSYRWMCEALHHYRSEPRAMSVTAWTHPRITPANQSEPYFDARAECWMWGAYARSWPGMSESALEKMAACERNGISPSAYGADLPLMARAESERNIWAVRWLYHHLQHGGLCLRPPWSMVEHIGFDSAATNSEHATSWANPPLRQQPAPAVWPAAREHPDCRRLWQEANPPLRWMPLRKLWRSVFPR